MEDILDDFSGDVSSQSVDWALRTYVGDEAKYYFTKLHKRNGQIFFSFNLAALILGLLWMVHRRMYLYVLYAVLFMIVMTRMSIFCLSDTSYFTFYISPAFNLIFAMVSGFMGNFIYFKNATRNIEKIRTMNLSEDAYEIALLKSGNPSWIHTILGILVMQGIFMVENYLFNYFYYY